MKKIIAFLSLLVITFTSSYATVGESTTINEDDLLRTQIFYINWEGYIKEDNKLKKVEWITFYSIAGVRYVNKNGKIEKMNEWKIHTINGVNYVNDNGKLKTLDQYIIDNPTKIEVGTFSDMYKKEINENIELVELNKYKVEKIRLETLVEVKEMILEIHPELTGTVQYLSKESYANEEFYRELKEYFYELGDTEIAKKLYILENIEKIDIDKLNKAIAAKLNNENITYTTKEESTNEISDITFEDLLEEIDLDLSIDEDTEFEFNSAEELNTNDTTTEDTTDNNTEATTSEEDEAFEELMQMFGDL